MRRFGPALVFVAVLGLSVAVGANAAPFAYIPNASGNDVSVIDTATNAIVAAVTVGSTADQTHGVAVPPDGARVYVTTISEQPYGHFGVAVIDTATNTVVKTIPLPPLPKAIAVAPDGKRVYVAN